MHKKCLKLSKKIVKVLTFFEINEIIRANVVVHRQDNVNNEEKRLM